MKTSFQKIEDSFEISSIKALNIMFKAFIKTLIVFLLGSAVFGYCAWILTHAQAELEQYCHLYVVIVSCLALSWILVCSYVFVVTFKNDYDLAVRRKYHGRRY